MTLMRIALTAAVALSVLGACAGGRPATSPTGESQPTTTPAPLASATDVPASPQVIEVTLTDGLRIEPASMTVPAGVPVTFLVTNDGQIEHELYLGDEAAQQEHEEEMLSGEPMHGHSNAVTVAPGQTEELTFTFAPGEWLAGCHVPGHYPAGMVATIEVTG